MSDRLPTAPAGTTLRGRLITFEGGEGSGKTTQIRLLRNRLAARDMEVVVTREPGGTPRAEAIRAILLGGAGKPFGLFAETLLFAAARADHVDRVIAPALGRGAVVLCDRFIDSTRVYQGSVARVPAPAILAFGRLATRGLSPHLTLVLDLPAALGLERAASRRIARGEGADRFEAETVAFHEQVREAYLAIADRERERCVVVDATTSVEAVSERIWAEVAPRLVHVGGSRDGGPA